MEIMETMETMVKTINTTAAGKGLSHRQAIVTFVYLFLKINYLRTQNKFRTKSVSANKFYMS